MLRFRTTTQFEKDYKRMQKRGKDVEKLDAVMQRLINEESLNPQHRDHFLTGNFRDRMTLYSARLPTSSRHSQ